MMISPNCPEHGRLALDLALGRLDDDDADRADEVIESCTVCREWWQVQFQGESAGVVDDAVAAVFEDLQLPARRRNHGWMAVAAAAIMTIGAATLWLAHDPMPMQLDPAERMTAIQSMDFENPELKPVTVSTSADLEAERVAEIPDFVPATVRAEDRLGIRVAVAAPQEAVVEIEAKPLFSGSFESGNLTDWGVPTT